MKITCPNDVIRIVASLGRGVDRFLEKVDLLDFNLRLTGQPSICHETAVRFRGGPGQGWVGLLTPPHFPWLRIWSDILNANISLRQFNFTLGMHGYPSNYLIRTDSGIFHYLCLYPARDIFIIFICIRPVKW